MARSLRGSSRHRPRRRRWRLLDAVRAQPVPGGPARGVERRPGRESGGVQRQDFVHDPAVSDDAAGVRSGVDRARRLRRPPGRVRPGAPRVRACAPHTRGNLASACAAISGNVAMLISVGTIGTPCSTNRGRCRGSRPVACSMQSIPASSMSSSVSSAKQCAVTRAPSSWAAWTASFSVRGREATAQVAGVAVDPVPHELDPAVPGAGLLAHGLHQVLRLHLDGEAPEVPPGPARCACPARMRRGRSARCWSQRVSWTAPASRTSRVPASQVGDGLLFGQSAPATAPPGPSPMWQCASTSPGSTQPSKTMSGAAAGRSKRQQAVHGPQPVVFRVRPGQDGAAELDDFWSWHQPLPRPGQASAA